MKGKHYLGIVVAATLALAGCTTNLSQKQYTQDKVMQVFDEPALFVKPFRYSGRTWFDTDKAILRPAGKAELDGLAQRLMNAKSQGLISNTNKVVVVGHTDSRASQAYNQKLSERRAASVAKYLSGKGIPASAIVAFGRGELQPVATNRTRAGMQQNRRVEIHIEGPAVRVVYN